MVAYSFKKRFVGLIEANLKLQTIRADRKRHGRPGEELQLYEAQRTRQCRLIGRPICLSVQPIKIWVSRDLVELPESQSDPIRRKHLDLFAKGDGFTDWADMKAFWQREHPDVPVFSGVVIRWRPFK